MLYTRFSKSVLKGEELNTTDASSITLNVASNRQRLMLLN